MGPEKGPKRIDKLKYPNYAKLQEQTLDTALRPYYCRFPRLAEGRVLKLRSLEIVCSHIVRRVSKFFSLRFLLRRICFPGDEFCHYPWEQENSSMKNILPLALCGWNSSLRKNCHLPSVDSDFSLWEILQPPLVFGNSSLAATFEETFP